MTKKKRVDLFWIFATADVEAAFQETRQWWDRILSTIEVVPPEPSTNLLLNRSLRYQRLLAADSGVARLFTNRAVPTDSVTSYRMSWPSCIPRPSSRAITFCAPLHDNSWKAMSNTGGIQSLARVSGRGSVTIFSGFPSSPRIAVRTTGDAAILDQMVPFLDAKPLEEQQTESLSIPVRFRHGGFSRSNIVGGRLRSATAGPHGLPLIGGGDWNDGLNRVGLGGKGESVWLAWFEICVRKDFAELLSLRELHDEARACQVAPRSLAKTVDAQAWDGARHRRAYFDDGTPLGSKENTEARIDSLPQRWAAISGAGDSDRIEVALRSLEENLVREADDLILLFTPPFDKTVADVGDIKGYPPGGRKTAAIPHAATWVAMAFARRVMAIKPSDSTNAESGRARPRARLRTLQGRAVCHPRRRLRR